MYLQMSVPTDWSCVHRHRWRESQQGRFWKISLQSQTCISRRKVSRYVEKSVRLYPCFFRMYDTAVCLQQTFYALFGRSAYDACCGNVSVPSKGYPEYRDSVDNCSRQLRKDRKFFCLWISVLNIFFMRRVM